MGQLLARSGIKIVTREPELLNSCKGWASPYAEYDILHLLGTEGIHVEPEFLDAPQLEEQLAQRLDVRWPYLWIAPPSLVFGQVQSSQALMHALVSCEGLEDVIPVPGITAEVPEAHLLQRAVLLAHLNHKAGPIGSGCLLHAAAIVKHQLPQSHAPGG